MTDEQYHGTPPVGPQDQLPCGECRLRIEVLGQFIESS